MRTTPFLIRALIILLPFIAAPALGDGKVFSVPSAIPATIPDQSALIVWRDGIQTLAIETSFEGGGNELAWVVPTPSLPTVEATTPGLFPTLRSTFVPEIEGISAYTTYFAWLVGWITACLVVGYGLRARVSNSMLFALLSVALLGTFTCLMPTLGRVRGSSDRPTIEDGVSVHDRKVVGAYDVSTISSADGTSLANWLVKNGYEVRGEDESVIARYVADGWCFVASRIRRDEAGTPARPHPLVLRFAAKEPVYPMPLTGTGGRALQLELFVFADGAATVPGLDAAYIVATNHARLRVLNMHQEAKRLIGDLPTATRLSGRLQPSQMKDDLRVSLAKAAGDRWPVRYSRAEVPRAAMVAGIGTVLVSGWVIFGMRRIRKLPWRVRCRIWAGVAVVAAGFAIAVRYGLPSVQTRVTRFGSSWSFHQSVGLELEQRFEKEEWTDRAAITQRVAAAAAEIVALQFGEYAPYLTGLDMPRREDSPGNWQLRWRSERGQDWLEYVTLDRWRGELALPVVSTKMQR
ncbi:MAG: DUF2330 domain-containing protein [Phycisphaerales bacterium]